MFGCGGDRDPEQARPDGRGGGEVGRRRGGHQRQPAHRGPASDRRRDPAGLRDARRGGGRARPRARHRRRHRRARARATSCSSPARGTRATRSSLGQASHFDDREEAKSALSAGARCEERANHGDRHPLEPRDLHGRRDRSRDRRGLLRGGGTSIGVSTDSRAVRRGRRSSRCRARGSTAHDFLSARYDARGARRW